MKFFRDSYRLTVSACEHFCTNHIGTSVWEPPKTAVFRGNFVYITIYTEVGLSSSSVYHKNQFYRFFSGGSPPQAGRAIRSNCLEAISATIPNPYASLTLPARPLRSQYSCRNDALRLPGLHLLSAPSLQIIAKASVSQIKTALRSTTLSAGLLCYFLAVMLFIRNKPAFLCAHYPGIPFIPFQLT